MCFRHSVFFAVLMLGASGASAQVRVEEGRLIRRTYSGGDVEMFDLNPPSVQGTCYLEENWQLGTVSLKDGRILKQVPVRLDLELNQLEVNVQGSVRALPGRMVRQFEWLRPDGSMQYFINADLFGSDTGIAEGFFEILYEGEYSLALKTDIIVAKPMYSQALDAGHKDTRILKKENMFLIGTSDNILPAPKKKGDLSAIFGPVALELEEFIKSERISLRDADGLLALLRHYESLEKQPDNP
jgi:hypothetical protein